MKQEVQGLLATCFIAVPWFAYSLTLMMEATYSPETWVDFQTTKNEIHF
jgi:hypothetical protein